VSVYSDFRRWIGSVDDWRLLNSAATIANRRIFGGVPERLGRA
jgi:hypothetical protein